MFSGFAMGKVLLRGLPREAKPFTRANEKFYLSPACRCDGLPRDGVLRSLDRQIDVLGDVLYGFTPDEIKIVEGCT